MTAITNFMIEMDDKPAKGSWIKRLGWLILIWTGSVLALALAAYIMRWLMRSIGLG